MSQARIILCCALIGISFVVSGCTIGLGQKPTKTKTSGGVFKTVDAGVTWSQPSLIATTKGAPLSIADVDIYSLAMDPSDNKAIYLATVSKGILYSYDAGATWTPVKDKLIAGRSILSLAVDPKNKCIIYASSSNKIFKSIDCSRTWQEIYSDNKSDLRIYSIVVDHYDSKVIYFGTSRGDLIKSLDGGVSWKAVKLFDREVRRVAINPTDSRIIMVALKNGKLFRSLDAGETWTDLEAVLKTFKGDRTFRDLVSIPGEANGWILAIKYGLLKTVNNGDDWTEIKILTPKQQATINSVALDYKDPNIIYYGTVNTFYRSTDSGQNWSSTKLPTDRRGWRLLTDPKNQGLLYLGVWRFE